jgi:glycosyltransferase involved in cell wall biosynthesis
MSTVTLSMIVKNEEKYLHGCLESVKEVVDEIVIVDTGSHDKTVEIAKEFDAKIFHFDWVNDFSAARNFALSKSSGDWILYLDADERLSKNSKNELIRKIKDNKRLGINCIINNLDDYKNSPKLMKYIRLFKNNDKIAFSGKAHEQIEPSLFSNNYKIVDSTIEIIHHGYNVPDEELKFKAKRNLELLLIEYKIDPNSYLSFQIANSYSILDDLENSVKFFSESLIDKNLRREFKSVCYLQLADYEMRRTNIKEAKVLVDKGMRIDNNHPLLNMIASQVYEKLSAKDLALNYCKKAYESNQRHRTKKNSNNVLDIIIDNTKIIMEGILLSLKFNSGNNKQFYMRVLKLENLNYYENIHNIISNTLNNNSKVDRLISFVDEKNLDLVLKLLKFNSNNEFKLDFFSKTYDKYNSQSNYLTNFGAFLLDINQIEEARVILEASLQTNNFDDAVIFYLASIYTITNNTQELHNLLQLADIKAESNQLLQSKLILLKEKLQPILSRSPFN